MYGVICLHQDDKTLVIKMPHRKRSPKVSQNNDMGRINKIVCTKSLQTLIKGRDRADYFFDVLFYWNGAIYYSLYGG